MEKPLRLMAVERDVGRIQIEDDLLRLLGMRLDEQIAEQRVDLLRREVDLVVALAAARKLQTVQRALAGQGLFHLAAASQHAHEWIVTQLVMIVHVLIAQRQPVDTLAEHLCELVGDQQRRTPVGEAGCYTVQQGDLAIRLAQQKCSPVARYLPSRETSFHAARKMSCKREDFLITL